MDEREGVCVMRTKRAYVCVLCRSNVVCVLIIFSCPPTPLPLSQPSPPRARHDGVTFPSHLIASYLRSPARGTGGVSTVSGWSAWTGLTAAKAARPARDRNEVAVARMVKACWRGHTEDCTHTTRLVCRKERRRVVCECLLCVRGMCVHA